MFFLAPRSLLKIMKLLIVEDNLGMRRLIKSLIFDLADEIVECEDGAEALKPYTNFHPDWFLMNIKMKKIEGLTATLTIKTAFPEAKICIITDYGDQKTIKAASE